MKVLIVNSMAPFVWGGAEELAAHLQRNLIAAGHESEVLRIPFRIDPVEHLPSQMLMVRNLELWNADRVIALKFPAYLIRHPHKTLWLLHQFRQAYDLFDAGQSHVPDDEMGEDIRRAVAAADAESFRESRRIFTNSEVTRERLARYNGFEATVLPPPLNDPELFTGGPSRGYIFAGGRVNLMKRQHLLVEALAKAPSSVRLVVAGPPDGAGDGRRLLELAARLGVKDRVKLDLRFLSRQEYARYVNEAAAVAYLPFDEDSLGYVAMEAATAGKALITTGDSGGVLGLVREGQTGWVAEPTAEGLAQAMAAAQSDAALTERRGKAARELWRQMGITWDKTVETLLA